MGKEKLKCSLYVLSSAFFHYQQRNTVAHPSLPILPPRISSMKNCTVVICRMWPPNPCGRHPPRHFPVSHLTALGPSIRHTYLHTFSHYNSPSLSPIFFFFLLKTCCRNLLIQGIQRKFQWCCKCLLTIKFERIVALRC